MDREQRRLFLLGVLVVAAFAFDLPGVLTSTLCDRPGEYDVEDVRISYSRATMIGPEIVDVRGRRVYYMDLTVHSGQSTYRLGTVSTATVRQLLSIVERYGVMCLKDQYQGIIIGTEPQYEDLIISTGTASKTIEITSQTTDPAPPQLERVIDAVLETGRAQPRLNASEFCARVPADRDGPFRAHCERIKRRNTL